MASDLRIGRAVLLCSNTVFVVVGLCAVLVGGLLMTSMQRVLMSRLLTSPDSPPHPLFFYVGLTTISVGVVVATGGVIGCWAATLQNRWFLAVYVFLLVLLLLAECSVGALAMLCPHYLGVRLSTEELVDNLQRHYATPRADQYTAAVDLAQTQFECCGMASASDYEMSWWNLRDISQKELLVPLSCCILSNADKPEAFLDPVPRNNSFCQSVDETLYSTARHSEGCSRRLEAWFKQHTAMFLAGSLTLVLVELSVILSTLLVCVKLPRSSSHKDRPA